MSSPRRSKRSRSSWYKSSPLQRELCRAIGNGGLGGIKRGARLLEVASDGEISSMDASWSPLAIAVMICGSASTMNGTNDKFEYELVRLIEACRRRGVSVDRGCLTYVSQRFIRPLVLAAYYGFYRSVEALLDAGATPNLVDGEGRTALHTAVTNPSRSKTWRACDRLTAELLFRRNAVTPSLREWKFSGGSQIYINCANSPLLTAIRHQNIDAAVLLCEQETVLTDYDFAEIRRKCTSIKSYRDWLPFIYRVATMLRPSNSSSPSLSSAGLEMWSEHLDYFIFPPTWKVAVALCGSCCLPEDIFTAKVIPFLPRHWFYTNEQLKRTPPHA